MGNVKSVANAFEELGYQAQVTRQYKDLEKASTIVLPGVGAFGDGMKNLKKLNFVQLLSEMVMIKKIPFLGICLGMQLLADESFEHGYHLGLGWIKGKVRRIHPENKIYKVPHIGWNNISIVKQEPLFFGLEKQEETIFYFVHSYYFDVDDKEVVSSTCWHGIELTASIQYENIYAVQFHPEKSQMAGLKLLDNFIKRAKEW